MNCIHEWHLIKGWNELALNPLPHQSRGTISICESCGLISIQDVTNGHYYHHEFRIYDDDSVAAIHRYRKQAGVEE